MTTDATSATDATPADGPEILRYAAFATDPAGGNPAGVVLDASGLSADRMLAIAAEVGYSETAFLVPGPGAGEYGVRYFSPLTEVPFCGHATVASAVALAERVGTGRYLYRTAAGEVPVEVAEDADGGLRATLTSVEPRVEEADAADVDEALALLGWAAGDLDPALPPRYAYAGARHLVLAAGTRDRLARLDYDFDGLAAFMTARDLVTVQLVWRAAPDVFHVRNPFPVGGVVEDPATGAAAAAFGAYLRDLDPAAAPAVLTLHQGEDLGRPGTLHVDLGSAAPRVRVSGAAVAIGQEDSAS
ncbi:PhzF family phenazine biosynthesis protein [Kitasatospora purpeofusca]|uniref:PhzF family phenazine biosynthesis protein n=1 Tax=Kitasatospora purpeofusca TaxID=67352 RepID=UPI00225155DC|nr:PhzF family phenazine biosynthesis isomerase [Kitasatospora purpeofusca]MCX4756032.1 PhzF family phenazine biosynthesis protein [Kitasatospora purpeofusca]WSR36125.1 PhzF family phenazine biosynthesis protein [Kitasatospora purpeofusca]